MGPWGCTLHVRRHKEKLPVSVRGSLFHTHSSSHITSNVRYFILLLVANPQLQIYACILPTGNNRNQTNGTDQRSHPETHTQPSLPSSPPITHKRPDDVQSEIPPSTLPKQLPLTRNGFSQVSKVQDPMSDPNSTAPVTSDLNIHMTSHVQAPLAPRDVVSSPCKG